MSIESECTYDLLCFRVHEHKAQVGGFHYNHQTEKLIDDLLSALKISHQQNSALVVELRTAKDRHQ